MATNGFVNFDSYRVPSPCFVVDEAALEDNLKLLAHIQKQSGAKVLLALKAFSMFSLAPLIGKYLSGICASGLYEARLGREEYHGEVHTFCTAYRHQDLAQVLEFSDHVVFNSLSQWRCFREQALQAQQLRPNLKFGLRINPLHSEGSLPLYDPCTPGSRLGIHPSELAGQDITGLSGLHFHTLCEQDLPPLQRTLTAVAAGFDEYLHKMDWVNFGGGHHITRTGYQVDALIKLITEFREKYQVQVYLEPGEAVALHTGVLVAEVLDVVYRPDINVAILDTSATCHMPDVLEMPYRPEVLNAGPANGLDYTYRLGGQTCLAGDVIGDYSFPEKLEPGMRVVFDEMAYYTMVKTNTFNGVPLPAIAIWNSATDALRIVKQFDYTDFKGRLS